MFMLKSKSNERITFWCFKTEIVTKSHYSVKYIGVGIIAIVVFPRDAKIVDMKFVYLIKHMLTFILWKF